MKLGAADCASHFARRLAPLVLDQLQGFPVGDWVLTAPPLRYIPAGANLIADRLLPVLQGALAGVGVRRVEAAFPRVPGVAAVEDADYARLDARARRRQRAQHGKPDFEERDVRGQRVIVINDICVSGTQQRVLARHLRDLDPEVVLWVYIVRLRPQLGLAHPELEYALNNSRLQSVRELATLVCNERNHITGKCLMRLLKLDPSDLGVVLERMSRERAQLVLRLARLEGRFQDARSRESLKLLQDRVSAGEKGGGERRPRLGGAASE